jgi:hypothetical protein
MCLPVTRKTGRLWLPSKTTDATLCLDVLALRLTADAAGRLRP